MSSLDTTSSASSAIRSGMARPGPQVAFDALELWVSNLRHTQNLFATAFGFQPAHTPFDGGRDERAAGLSSGEVRLILRQGTSPASPISRHVAEHGDTVADVALVCADPGAVVARAHAQGLRVYAATGGTKIDLFGDRTVCHTVREARPVEGKLPPRDNAPVRVDHVAYCLPWGFADKTAALYEEVFGLQRIDADSFDAVGGDASGMRAVVLRSGPGFTVVLTEPASPASAGQTQRFIDVHAGPGVQHAAFAYNDLFTAVESLRSSGVKFLPAPGGYYDQAQKRLQAPPVNWAALRRLGILVDADDHGLLLQLFTRPLTSRGTFFVEVIQRMGATGFGANNVRALFAAVQATANEHPDS